jgi:site-specific DNA-cytosine methylase
LGPKKDVARQIGNAVAPRMACAVAASLMTTLASSNPREQASKRRLSA